MSYWLDQRFPLMTYLVLISPTLPMGKGCMMHSVSSHWKIYMHTLYLCNMYNARNIYKTPSIIAQFRSMLIKILALITMSINSDQCWSIPIDRHWEELIDNGRHLGSMPWFWRTLGFDNWALIEVVLYIQCLVNL